eukprot:TRINITY_DN13789_c0_g1_i1.p1 TRINITY_DN13789_c0_g1~~TRINITY_DN13789_c0_g1_i1.p1  ORF type:complete len:325 (+),score=26.03 TRINITY_DN13789_c0_g1_i1:394-1368(+)
MFDSMFLLTMSGLQNRVTFSECTHMSITWRILQEYDLYAPKVESLDLFQSFNADCHASDVCDRIQTCFPSLSKLKFSRIVKEAPIKYDVVYRKLPQLRSLHVLRDLPQEVLQNDYGTLQKLHFHPSSTLVSINIPDLRVSFDALTLAVPREPSNLVTSLRILNVAQNFTRALEWIVPELFPNLRRLSLDNIRPPQFQGVLRLHQLSFLRLQFAYYSDMVKFLELYSVQTQHFALSSLAIDTTDSYSDVERIKWAMTMPAALKHVERAVMQLAHCQNLQNLRLVSISPAFLSSADIQNLFLKRGISLWYRTCHLEVAENMMAVLE